MEKVANKKIDKKKKGEKNNSRFDAFFDMALKPMSEPFLKERARALLEWLEATPSAYTLGPFFEAINISERTWYRWIEINDHIKMAHERALCILGDRRERWCSEGKLDPCVIKGTFGQYLLSYQKDDARRAKLREDSDCNETVRIILEQIPHTKEVTDDISRKNS